MTTTARPAPSRRFRTAVIACITLLASSLTFGNPSAASFENLLDTPFFPASGMLSFGDYTVAFAPEGSVDATVAVLDASGEIVGQHGFFPDYVLREGVFGVLRARGPAEVTLTTPGLYTIVLTINGQPVSRLPVRYAASASGADPFNTAKTHVLDGYWRTRAYFLTRAYKNTPVPDLVLWVGGPDLPAGRSTDQFFVEAIHEGQVRAHSKRRLGHIAQGHFKRTQISLFLPHEDRASANAGTFSMAQLTTEGAWEIRVSRASDGKVIRSFDFDVRDGRIEPMPQTSLGYQPATDYVLPRVSRKNTNTFEMVEALWIEDRR